MNAEEREDILREVGLVRARLLDVQRNLDRIEGLLKVEE